MFNYPKGHFKAGMSRIKFEILEDNIGRVVKIPLKPYSTPKNIFIEQVKRDVRTTRYASITGFVPEILDFQEDDIELKIILKAVPGVNLREFIRENNFSLDHMGFYVELADRYGDLHDIGIVHRDISTKNIILNEGIEANNPWILDFAFSDITDLTEPRVGKGTPAYISPENASRGFVSTTQASDIYSFGTVLFHALTNRTVFPYITDIVRVVKAHMREKPELVSVVNPELPKELDGIVDKCLQKNPRDRYLRMSHVAEDLHEVAEKYT